MADEAPVDEVYLGEVVCSKREPFFEPYYEEVMDRLIAAGKKINISSLAMITLPREREQLHELAEGDHEVEANDIAAVQLLKGKPFIIGPYITVLNEGALRYLMGQGAKRIVFASELSGKAMTALAAACPDSETEAQIFGRQPLAIAMRCYSSRAAGRDKDHCRLACAMDEDGLVVQTLDKQDIWAISGTQTLSAGMLVLAQEVVELQNNGITHFRLAPQDMDMVQISKLYRDLLDGKKRPDEILSLIHELNPDIAMINGYFHEQEGNSLTHKR
jgi:collagenase-like PrtC family protease